MDIISHGIDLVECSRIEQMLDRYGNHLLDRVFTPAEQDYCLARKRKIEHLAGRFAVKEAVMKVLGSGWKNGLAWTDIETRNDPAGKPIVRLTGGAAQLAEEIGIQQVLISISHTKEYAIASALALK